MAPGHSVAPHVDSNGGQSAERRPARPSLTSLRLVQNLAIQEGAIKALEIADFFRKHEGSSLKAWLKHFDRNNESKINQGDFLRGMRKLNYPGDSAAVFAILDRDRSGELALDEIDAAAATLWRSFRQWCVATFEGPREMMSRLSKFARSEKADESGFSEAIVQLGWKGGSEQILYQALDIEDIGELSVATFKWLEVEKRGQRRKEQAKKQVLYENLKRMHDKKESEHLLNEFRAFLKRKFGNYVRAWRKVLSRDDSMVLQKRELFRACHDIGWQGDVRLLWRALDRDDSGYVSIEELDAKSAEVIAHFHRFVQQKFGNAANAFRSIDKYNQKKIRQKDFIASVKGLGFEHDAKFLFEGLDYELNSHVVEEDLVFLDKWTPPPFLTSPVNAQAAEDIKQLLLEVYKNYLKAWRHCLDVDSSNHVNWEEFELACKKIKFPGDIPGAWRALDRDLSGFISLAEIDPVASETLLAFKMWADEEFGGVRSAFSVIDNDGSSEVSYREFRRACRLYGFSNDIQSLFQALDVEGNGQLSVDEVVFLDDWEIPHEVKSHTEEGKPSTPGDAICNSPRYVKEDLVQYVTDGPGPASHASQSQLGAGPTVPMVKFNGAYSFRKRPNGRLPGLQKDAGDMPSPVTYDYQQGVAALSRRTPAFSFGGAPREVTRHRSAQSTGPGPAHYSPSQMHMKGPAAMCSPRRPLKVHPLFREGTPISPRV